MTTYLLALVLTAGASEPTSPVAKTGSARIAAVEREFCVARCPVIPSGANSDWLRSAEGQKANACNTGCRLEQPAAGWFQSACDIASSSTVNPETSLVKLSGKDGPELARRLRAALKEAEGKKPTPVCARARASLGTIDETAYLECTRRIVTADGAVTIGAPEPARALRCAASFAERNLDWLRRCPAMETATVEACLEKVEVASRSRRQSADQRSQCENDAVERIAAAFRNKTRP